MKYFFILSIILLTTSCTELLQLAGSMPSGKAASATVPVSSAENIAGLKQSLELGITGAVNVLHAENGFYGNELFKLMLPAEAKPIVDNIRLIPGGQELVEKAILSINRSAEDAVKEAGPIFKNAIRSMTISDAAQILFGSDNAATEYLKASTYTQLHDAFRPKIAASLSKPLVAGVSTTETWNTLSKGYNKAAGSTAGMLLGLKPVTIDLQEYVTGRALDALFVKVAEEEKAIRTNPAARVNALLKRVFGQLDAN
ncbi:MAG: hypothetical protein BGP01_11440 [Paludibacter sp. 47-17]|nr:MAG: hypothetical protein BGP01_11440 [Paludibacter sp. 47-17]